MVAPSIPKIMIHHSLALSLRTRYRGTWGISPSSLSKSSNVFCLSSFGILSNIAEGFCWSPNGLWGVVVDERLRRVLLQVECEWRVREMLLQEESERCVCWLLLVVNSLPSPLVANPSSTLPHDWMKQQTYLRWMEDCTRKGHYLSHNKVIELISHVKVNKCSVWFISSAIAVLSIL